MKLTEGEFRALVLREAGRVARGRVDETQMADPVGDYYETLNDAHAAVVELIDLLRVAQNKANLVDGGDGPLAKWESSAEYLHSMLERSLLDEIRWFEQNAMDMA